MWQSGVWDSGQEGEGAGGEKYGGVLLKKVRKIVLEGICRVVRWAGLRWGKGGLLLILFLSLLCLFCLLADWLIILLFALG